MGEFKSRGIIEPSVLEKITICAENGKTLDIINNIDISSVVLNKWELMNKRRGTLVLRDFKANNRRFINDLGEWQIWD